MAGMATSRRPRTYRSVSGSTFSSTVTMRFEVERSARSLSIALNMLSEASTIELMRAVSSSCCHEL